MKTKILFIKHIHSCFAAFSSNDVLLGIEMNSEDFPQTPKEPIKPNKGYDFFQLLDERQNGNKIDTEARIETEGSVINFPGHILHGELINEIVHDPEYPQYIKVYLEPDKTYYDKALANRKKFDGYSDTPEFKLHVEYYIRKGWLKDYKTDDTRAFDKFREDKKLFGRAENELVLWNYGKDDFELSQYQGGFSNEFYQGDVQKYCENGGVFGWMGNTEIRTRPLDKFLESEFNRRVLSLEPLKVWVTSTDARHFADSLCGENQTEQEMKIKMNINRIYNLGLVYGDQRHEGTFGSTQKVRSLLEVEGTLLTETQDM